MLKQRNNAGKLEIFDPIRRKWIALTGEERIRQCFILFMIREKQIPASHISVEKQIKVNGLLKRYDIVVYNSEKKIALVVECKAPNVAIDQNVVEQVGRYNKTLQSPVIGVTNGQQHLFFSIDFDTDAITFLQDFPQIN